MLTFARGRSLSSRISATNARSHLLCSGIVSIPHDTSRISYERVFRATVAKERPRRDTEEDRTPAPFCRRATFENADNMR